MNIVRLAISLGEVDGKRFNKLLSSIIMESLFSDSNKNLSTSKIQEIISKKYKLSFSTSEIEEAIDSDRELFETYKENNLKFCSLSSKGIEKISKRKSSEFNYDGCIDLFISENKALLSGLGSIEKNTIRQVIEKYVYNSFNTDKEQLEYLLVGRLKETPKNKNWYTYWEIRVIKCFLDWDNEDKNKFVFNVVKSAYSYCILTTKENPESSMFSYKDLYLDTNVIFSLAGINGKERMYSTKAFIKKATELHCKLFYTSETASESKATLKRLVESMCSIVKKDYSFTCEELKKVFPSSNPAALFQLYRDWSIEKPSRNGDYNGFYNYMKEVLNDTLDELTHVPIDKDFLNNNYGSIENSRISIATYKERLGRRHSEYSTRADAVNYKYISKIRNSTTTTIKNQDIFFVSADTGLCKWASEQSSGCINVFLLPSIMYSLLLRFSSRTSDDYKSFNDFVSLCFDNEYISQSLYDAKEEMIKAVSSLDMPTDAKKKVLHVANRELERQAKHNQIIDKISVEKAVDKSLDNFYTEFEKMKDDEKCKAILETEKAKYAEGHEDALKAIASKKAKGIVHRNKILSWFITLVISFLTIGFLGYAIFVFVVEKTFSNVGGWILGVIGLLGLPSIVVSMVKTIKNSFLETNYDKVYNKELLKNRNLIDAPKT